MPIPSQTSPNKKASPPAPALAMAQDPARALLLAETFQPDIDLLTREGLIAFGIKGSGKSQLLARIVEQCGRFFLPQVIFDTEGEYASAINHLPHGVLGSIHRMPSGFDILHKGLQLVVDLRSWQTDEAAALAMVQLLSELFTTAQQQAEQDRVPCPVYLDEASYWLPEDAGIDYLAKTTRQALATTFHTIATRGRKLGLVPCLFTQSISEIKKTAIRQAGIKVLMRQTLDTDLKRYCEFIKAPPARIKKLIPALPAGRAVVILPDGSQPTVQFYPRESAHPSGTPRAQAAISKFAMTAVNLDSLTYRDMTSAQEDVQAATPRRQVARTEKTPTAKKPKHTPNFRDRVFTLLKHDPMLTNQQLSAMIGIPVNSAQIARRDYFIQFPDRLPPALRREPGKIERRVRELLEENPGYTASQIAHRTRTSLNYTRKIMARIQESQEALPNG